MSLPLESVAFAPPSIPTERSVADWPSPAATRQVDDSAAEHRHGMMLVPYTFEARRASHLSHSTGNPHEQAQWGLTAGHLTTWPMAGEGREGVPSPTADATRGESTALPELEDLSKLELLQHLPEAPSERSPARAARRFGAFFRPASLLEEGARFIVVQKWEGAVTAVEGDFFIARLTDLTAGAAQEEVELPLEEVSDDDRSLVESGAVFYWSIGYDVARGGQRTRASRIRFRRLPAWTAKELGEAKERAKKLKEDLGW